ncbi:hypothetical protein MSSAC_1538 [Methanosarcina siciliae C2J]|uniref:DUF4145 domain-containing protein n=1 Tax=Methanosarcina siciliae C2J TaxID=1434118 RepID=A0A0E3PNQ5_9EURY|nr:DUF4145 domain-containing protein [Methanosarcina siciliae]AKB36128.1 hypothetical protein MSSAC_1538 [Methanosarcina siciliae C2J]
MSVPYIKPSYKKSEFNCPYSDCNVYAHQKWNRVIHYDHSEVNSLLSYEERDTSEDITPLDKVRYSKEVGASSTAAPKYPAKNYIPTTEVEYASVSKCSHCNRYAFWIKDKMIYPVVSLAPLPSDDMPEDVKADYTEAASIVEASPRASSALLRLALQKLMPHIGERGQKIDEDIGSLVKKGLPTKIQQSLDLVRVIGNESVHPGQLDLKDDKDTAYILFGLLNYIVQDRITNPKEIDALYSKLPQKKLDGINNRDKK